MRSAGAGYPLPWGRRHSLENNNCQYLEVKGILWQFYKLVLKVPSGRDENDGIGHFAELGSSWPGEAKTWPKIALRVGGRAEKYCVGGRAAGRYWAARPPTQNIAPVLQHVALFLATFWTLQASWSRVQQNDLYHRFRLGHVKLPQDPFKSVMPLF